MSDQTINVGVIGLGFMGATHVAAYQAAAAAGCPCRLMAACDPDLGRCEARIGDVRENLMTGSAAARLDASEVRGYASAEELLADPEVRLVSICTPTPTHVELAEQAMRAGKHVLVEKPVALTAEPVRRLAAVADGCGVICMPAMCMRFWPAWAWLKGAVEDRRFGAVRSISLTRLGRRPAWNAFYADAARSGGALVDLHVHDTDFLIHLFGPPSGVRSTGDLDHVTTLYDYPTVPHVAAEGGWDQHEGFGFTMRYLVNFECATADFDIGRELPLRLCADGRATAVDLEPISGYDGEVRHLIDCLAHERRPLIDLHDAVTTHRVIDAERESIARGGSRMEVSEIAAEKEWR